MLFKKKLFSEIREYLKRNYEGEDSPASYGFAPTSSAPGSRPAFLEKRSVSAKRAEHSAEKLRENSFEETFTDSCSAPAPMYSAAAPRLDNAVPNSSLKELIEALDESFQESLLRMIDEKGMKDSECYKKAGIDRKLFSKIRSNPSYRPSKPTAIAFALALGLDLGETEAFIRKAGYALSHSSKFDVIIEYFIVNGRYNIREINEALYEFDQPLLGA